MDCSQSGFPNTKVQVFNPNENIGDLFLKLDQLCSGPQLEHSPPVLKPTVCLLVMAQRLLVACSHLPFSIFQKFKTRINFEWSCHILSHEWEGTSHVVRTQINFTLRTLSTHIRYAHHQESAAHLEHLIDLYEVLKEGPLALLDEVSKFKDKYIYGSESSVED